MSNVLIDLKLREFSLRIQAIFEACEALKDDCEPEETYGINESQFRDFIQKIYRDMQKYLPVTSPIYNYYEILWPIMLLFSLVIIITYCFLKPEIYYVLFIK